MDVRNVIFPMTAGDLVESAQVLCQVQRGDGPDIRLAEVLEVTSRGTQLEITLKDTATYDTLTVTLNHDTPLLVTGIRRN